MQPLIVAWTVIVPLAFLAALEGFDYWAYWVSRRPTRPERPLRPRRPQLARLLPCQHRPQGHRHQYLVTTIFFFVGAGLMAMFITAAPKLAKPGIRFVDNNTFNGLFSVHASLMIFLFVIPAFAGLGNYVIPLMISAPDMAFPRLNALSF